MRQTAPLESRRTECVAEDALEIRGRPYYDTTDASQPAEQTDYVQRLEAADWDETKM